MKTNKENVREIEKTLSIIRERAYLRKSISIDKYVSSLSNLIKFDCNYGREGNNQTCNRCGHRDYFNFEAPNNIWDKVTGGKYYVLCLPCFDALAYEKGVDYVSKIKNIVFIGDGIMANIKPILIRSSKTIAKK